MVSSPIDSTADRPVESIREADSINSTSTVECAGSSQRALYRRATRAGEPSGGNAASHGTREREKSRENNRIIRVLSLGLKLDNRRSREESVLEIPLGGSNAEV